MAKRRMEQDYHALAEKKGFKWLGPFPKDVRTKTGWECMEGHCWQAPYYSIQGGFGCRECHLQSIRKRVGRTCEQCGKTFEVTPSVVKQGRGRFCSRRCFLKWHQENSAETERVCEQCGKTLKVWRYRMKIGQGRFCSSACYGQSMNEREERICKQCGQTFLATLCQMKRGGGFCSRACVERFRIGINHPNWKGDDVEMVCEQCGKPFMVRPSRPKRFCSKDCKDQWQVGSNTSNWKGGKVTRICEQCGKTFEVFPYLVKRGMGKFCSKECRIQSTHTSVEMICEQCGKIFEIPPNEIKAGIRHCSMECQGRWRSENLVGPKASRWNGGKVEQICEQCGEAFEMFPGSERRFCSRECARVANVSFMKAQWERGKFDGIFLAPYKSTEVPLAAALDICGIEHIPQYRPNGYTRIYDEFIPPDVLIETHGDYWHGPKRPENQKRDAEKAMWAEENGYRLVVIWEHEIKEQGAWSLVHERVLPLLG